MSFLVQLNKKLVLFGFNLLRYCSNLKKAAEINKMNISSEEKSAMKKESLAFGCLTVEEENAAELYLCQCVQSQCFAEEIASIEKCKAVNMGSSLKMLNPIIGSDGLVRSNSRLVYAECLTESAKTPIILPNHCKFTQLLVQQYHCKFLHMYASTIICEIRQKFWIPSLRRLVNSVQAKCMICKLRKARPIQPQMSALPVDRLRPFIRPFSYSGVDYCGPFNVSIRRAKEKRWICLFTCMSVRAVHLEVSKDLSSDSFILCLRNFMNRRGVPVQLRSDNGTNFVGVRNELRGEKGFIDHNEITSRLAPLGIKWVFNTPGNPAQGGVWERLVQSTKKALYATLKEEAPRIETFVSLLIEAECIINSRPLTHIPVTQQEPEPLTPNHFLLGCANSTQTPGSAENRLNAHRKQWRVLLNMKNCLWKRWMREYLPELTRRTKWCLPTKPLSVGCLVLVCDPSLPRSQWKRGRITELYHGADGIARSAEIVTTNGSMQRPVSRLAMLDCDIA